MPRKTRAAAKAQEAILADVDDAPQEVPLPPTPKRDREPLRSITPNSVDSLDNERPAPDEMSKAKGKKGKKGGAKKKGKKTKAETVNEEPENVEEAQEETTEPIEVLPETNDDREEQSASVGEPVVVAPEVQEPQERPKSSLGRSTRMTRRQQAKAEAEAETEAELEGAPEEQDQADAPAQAPLEDAPTAEEPVVIDEPAVSEEQLEPVIEAPEPKAIAGELILSPPEPNEPEELPATNTPSLLARSQNIEALSPTLQELPDRTRPEPLSLVASNSTSRRTSQVEEGIEAIDALEDEIDEVAKIIPALDSPLSPVKPRSAKKAEQSRLATKTTSTSKPAAPRTNKLAATTQPSATARIRSLAEPKKPATTLSRTASTKARPKSVVVDSKVKDKNEGNANEPSKPVDYLAAKRRPVSVSFPTPPPPPKSKKPTTVSNFTLPGEAVAAKLKAQKLERQKREEEEAARKREFKARPVPTVSTAPCIHCGYRPLQSESAVVFRPKVTSFLCLLQFRICTDMVYRSVQRQWRSSKLPQVGHVRA